MAAGAAGARRRQAPTSAAQSSERDEPLEVRLLSSATGSCLAAAPGPAPAPAAAPAAAPTAACARVGLPGTARAAGTALRCCCCCCCVGDCGRGACVPCRCAPPAPRARQGSSSSSSPSAPSATGPGAAAAQPRGSDASAPGAPAACRLPGDPGGATSAVVRRLPGDPGGGGTSAVVRRLAARARLAAACCSAVRAPASVAVRRATRLPSGLVTASRRSSKRPAGADARAE
jgi:hypothetical protein